MPLAGRRFVVAGRGPIADECAALLQVLDADVVRVARVTPGSSPPSRGCHRRDGERSPD
jgi:phosphoglycerate dehydrogenase-like enzyme